MLKNTIGLYPISDAYAEFGKKNYLKSKDEIYVIVYDKRKSSADIEATESKIILHQKVL